MTKKTFLLSLSISGLLFAETQKDIKSPIAPEKKVSHQELIPIDSIRVVYRGTEGNEIITDSEIKRPKLDGTSNTLNDLINQIAFSQEAKRYHMWPSQEDVDKQLRMVAQANNMPPAELDNLFLSYHYTPSEGRQAFGQMTAINNLINFKISSNIFVPEKDVIAYYNAHPQYEDASYYIQYAFVAFEASLSKEEQYKNLKFVAQKNDPDGQLEWSEPFWVNEGDLSEDKKFLGTYALNTITPPLMVNGGYGFFKIVERKDARLKTLEERYKEIVDLLRRPKYSEMMGNYQKSLLEKASITEFKG